jgi:hypothetical protein
MTTASRLLWEACGSPRASDCTDIPDGSRCWVCGGTASRGVDRQKWNGAEFVGQNNVRAWGALHLCEPCFCVMAWTTPPLMAIPGVVEKPGSKRSPCWRNYSVLYESGRARVATKGDKPAILAFLRSTHTEEWFASIADSGQKHVVPYTPINGAGSRGRIRFEERTITLPDANGWRLVDDATALLTSGATKEEIARGEYSPSTWQRCGEMIDAFEAAHGSERGGAWFDLAVWLSQRDEAAVAARFEAEKAKKQEAKGARRKAKANTGDTDGGVDSRATGRVPRKPRVQRAQALGSDARPDASVSADDGDRGRMGDERTKRAETECTEPRQRSLF